MPAVLALQSLALIAPLPVGVLALRVASRVRSPDSGRAAWLLAGVCFGILGLNGVFTAVFSQWAFHSGPGSTALRLWLVWQASGNYSRLLVVLVFACALLVLSLRRQWAPKVVAPAAAAMGLALVAGVGMGLAEGTFEHGTHIPRIAVLSAALVIVLLGGLLAALATDAIDRLLWLVLGVYALKNALTVILLSVVAWVEHARQVPPATLYAMHLIVWLAMILLALHRYQLATRNGFVPAIFERSPVRRRVMV